MRYRWLVLLMAVCSCCIVAAQEPGDSVAVRVQDTVAREAEAVRMMAEADSIEMSIDSIVAEQTRQIKRETDSIVLSLRDSVGGLETPAVKEKFMPDPKKALWMAIVFPGGGQIYNRKYWKLPLVYGGFLGCMYAMTWNNTMYRDYSQAYIDIMDSDENTKSYENFIPKSYDIQANMQRLKDLFRRKKNFYRRYRDLSMFCMIGVYALSIVDAYVDAELSSFDISPDLSVKVKPTVISDKDTALRATGMGNASYGLQCSLSF